MEPSIESILRRDFRIIEMSYIAKGGFKTVYKIKLDNGSEEALKVVLLPAVGEDESQLGFYAEALARISREITVLGRCTVPELVRLGSVAPARVEAADGEYVVYSEEYLVGKDLWHEILEAPTKPDERELKQLFRSLLVAIRELWSLGFVHRDIKPANVVRLTDHSRPFVLLDLGISFGVRETALTYNPTMRIPPGTYRYMAPEMTEAGFRKELDFRSDLYTAALTVYEYAAKAHPFARSHEDPLSTLSRSIREAAPPLWGWRQDLSEDFCDLIDQMLKKKPGLRPSNFGMLIEKMETP